MGQARLRLKRSHGVPPIRQPRTKINVWAGENNEKKLREAHAALTDAQKERKLPTVSWDVFIEQMMMSGLEKLNQLFAAARDAQTPGEQKMIVTPAEALAEAQTRRPVVGPPMFAPIRK